MPALEVLKWRAYWKLKNEAEKKHMEKARRESGSRSRRR